MKRKADGFSLVEVIIAVAVLAVTVMFLLSYFSGANRYANWGKKTQKADMAAQSVVEELASCTTMEQVENMVTASGGSWKVASGASWETVSGSSWEVIATPDPSGDNAYYLTREVSADDTNYKARVKLDFAPYEATPPPAATGQAAKFNLYEVPQLEDVYSKHSVVLEETDQTASATGELVYQVYQDDRSISKSTIENGLKRTMHIHILPYADASGGNSLYLVKGYYEYLFENAGRTYKSEMPIKDVKIEKDNLQKIYLFYRPVNALLENDILDISVDSSMPAGFNLTDYAFYPILQKDSVNPPSNYQLTVDTSGGTVTSAELLKKVFTNAKLAVGTSAGLVTRKAEARIAKVTVEIYYEDETVFNEENRIVMVQTSKGV